MRFFVIASLLVHIVIIANTNLRFKIIPEMQLNTAVMSVQLVKQALLPIVGVKQKADKLVSVKAIEVTKTETVIKSFNNQPVDTVVVIKKVILLPLPPAFDAEADNQAEADLQAETGSIGRVPGRRWEPGRSPAATWPGLFRSGLMGSAGSSLAGAPAAGSSTRASPAITRSIALDLWSSPWGCSSTEPRSSLPQMPRSLTASISTPVPGCGSRLPKDSWASSESIWREACWTGARR